VPVGGWSVEFKEEGLANLKAVLKEEQPKVLRTLNKHLRGIGKDLADAAFVKTGGFGAYGVGLRKTGLIVMAAGGGARASRNDWSDPGVLASILESFGAKSTTTARSAACKATLDARYGKPGRFLNAAWKDGSAGYRQRAYYAAAEAESSLQAHLTAKGCGE
jgi:hypothetical protein